MNVKAPCTVFTFCAPLPVLIQAADDLVPLFNDCDQLTHQLLLSISILLTPVTL